MSRRPAAPPPRALARVTPLLQVADGPPSCASVGSTSLDGSAEPMGDLQSLVLHGMEMSHVKSTFPMSLGARRLNPRPPRPRGRRLAELHLPSYPD